ncbi:MAG: response regulator [Opitutales bacterium]|nr:response regulator [Opitutales bacterium]
MNLSTPSGLSVLFVDDQPILLKMLLSFLEIKAPDWRIQTAKDGPEALEVLEKETPEIVVSDMNMPGMDGMNLLQNVKQKHPSLIRFILSGQPGQGEILKSVGVAHQFLNKPVKMEELFHALELSRSLYRRVQDPKLQEMISNVGTLPTPRDVYFKISKMLEDPELELGDIAQVISEDASISAKILQLVNSAYFGFSSRMDSIADAVGTLGIENIRSLILIIGVSCTKNEEIEPFFDVGAFGRHSLEVGKLCRTIGKMKGLKGREIESVFTAGLLHDIGKLVIVDHHLDTYRERCFAKEQVEKPHLEVEESGFEKNKHPLVGAALLALWGMPAKVVNAVAYHHEPSETDSHLAAIVHLAESITNAKHLRLDWEEYLDTDFVQSEVVEALDLGAEVQELMAG